MSEAQALAVSASTSSAAATRPARRRSTSPGTPAASDPRPRRGLAATMSQYLIDTTRGPEHRGADAHRGRRRARRGAARAAAAADAGRRRDGAGRGADRPDRRPSAHRVAAGRDRPRRVGLPPDRARRPGWPLERPPFSLETSLPGVFAAGDVRARAVKRSPPRRLGRARRQRRARVPRARPALHGPFTADARRRCSRCRSSGSPCCSPRRTPTCSGSTSRRTSGSCCDRRAERRPRLRDRRGGAPAGRPARPPRLALVPRRLRLPRPARAGDARRPARQAESRLRDRDAGRARPRRRPRGALGHRREPIRPKLLEAVLLVLLAPGRSSL